MRLRNAEHVPNRKGCYKEGAKSKSYAVQIKSEEHQRQADFERAEEFNAKAKVRYKIEAKNAELKNVFGYDRADSYGLDCMCMQGAIVIFATNIKRILSELRAAHHYPKIRLHIAD